MIVQPLTKEERLWISKLQHLLNQCPSKRFGFYTTGNCAVTVIDLPATEAYDRNNGYPEQDYCTTVRAAGSELGELVFPSAVQSTAG